MRTADGLDVPSFMPRSDESFGTIMWGTRARNHFAITVALEGIHGVPRSGLAVAIIESLMPFSRGIARGIAKLICGVGAREILASSVRVINPFIAGSS